MTPHSCVLGQRLTGESIFLNEITTRQVTGEFGIASEALGDLVHRYLDNDRLFQQNSAYVAPAMSVAIETTWQGLVKGFFGEDLFLICWSGFVAEV